MVELLRVAGGDAYDLLIRGLGELALVGLAARRAARRDRDRTLRLVEALVAGCQCEKQIF
jgi:hypothetical protein